MAEIRINRPRDVVWRICIDLKSWKYWWGGVLKRVNPGWQAGAILEWKNGDRTTVIDFLPLERISTRGSCGEVITLRFTPDGLKSTVVVMKANLDGSTLRETSPGALESEFQTALSKFKKYVENAQNDSS